MTSSLCAISPLEAKGFVCNYFCGIEGIMLYADSAYFGKAIFKTLPSGLEIRVHEKGSHNHPLTEEQKANNKEKLRIRVRIEHIFGFMTNFMNGITVRSIGKLRAMFNA